MKNIQEQSSQVVDISEDKSKCELETTETTETTETNYVTGVSEVEKDNEIRRLHRVLLKLNEKLMDMDAPD